MILCRVSYTRIYALGVLYQTKVVYPFRNTKSDTSNREVNINFYNVIIGFYKVCVTVIKIDNQYFPKVVQAVATDDYKVYAYFDDGSIQYLDMTIKITSGVFQQIKDIEIFKNTLTILNDTVAWDLNGNYDPSDCIDIDPFAIYAQPDISENEFLNDIAI